MQYVYNGDKIVLEVDGNNAQQTRYLYGHQLILHKAGSTESYYIFNGHGDTVRLTNAANYTTATYDYDAFGNILVQDTPDAETDYLYSGYQYDAELADYYLLARYYNPASGRFKQQDPYFGPGNAVLGSSGSPSYISVASSNNLYAYCASSPMRYTDPKGLLPIDAPGYQEALEASAQRTWNAYAVRHEMMNAAVLEQERANGSNSVGGVGHQVVNHTSTGPYGRAAYYNDSFTWYRSDLITWNGAVSPAILVYLDYYTQCYLTSGRKNYDLWYRLAMNVLNADHSQITGNVLMVPVYNQLDTVGGNKLCWATCAAMMISYNLGAEKYSDASFIAAYLEGDLTDRTLEIAIETARFQNPGEDPTDPAVYSVARAMSEIHCPYMQFDQREVTYAEQRIMHMLSNSKKPFAVLVGAYLDNEEKGYKEWNGHWIVATGYASAPGHDMLIVYNDPWNGVQRIVSYNDFFTYPNNVYEWAWTATY